MILSENVFVANTKVKIIFKMFFLKISDANVLFKEKMLILRSYITNKALPTIKQVQIINKKKFAIIASNMYNKIFVIYVTI